MSLTDIQKRLIPVSGFRNRIQKPNPETGNRNRKSRTSGPAKLWRADPEPGESGIPGLRRSNPETESGNRKPESGILNLKSVKALWHADPEPGIGNPESRIPGWKRSNLETESGSQKPETGIRNPEPQVRQSYMACGPRTRKPDSGICNLESRG